MRGAPETRDALAPGPVRSRWRAAWRLIRSAIAGFSEDHCGSMAAALAFYAAFSLAPMLLIVIAIAGAAFGADAVEGRMVVEIRGLVGEAGAQAIQAMVASAWRRAGEGVWATALSLTAIVLGATGTFAELDGALNRIWHDHGPPRAIGWLTMLRTRLVSFGLVVGVGFLLVVLLFVDAGLSFAAERIWGDAATTRELAQALQRLLSWLCLAAAFALLIEVLPDAPVAWRDAMLGGMAAAVLFVAGKGLFGLYLSRAGTANAFGAAGSLAVVLMWLFYSASVFLFGAELAARRQRERDTAPRVGDRRFGRHDRRREAPTESPRPDSRPLASASRS